MANCLENSSEGLVEELTHKLRMIDSGSFKKRNGLNSDQLQQPIPSGNQTGKFEIRQVNGTLPRLVFWLIPSKHGGSLHPLVTLVRPCHIEVHIAVPRAGDQQAPFPVHRQCLRGFVRAGSNPSGSWAAVSVSRLQLVIWDFSSCDDVVTVVAFFSVPPVPITENVGHVGT